MSEGALKLLIVDDDDVDREKIRRMLGASACHATVEEAASVADSMVILGDHECDCVIVDYRLGSEDGLTLLNNIRTSFGKRCAVIMVTGLGDEKVAAEAMRLGASDYLIKGQLESAQLFRAILSAIQRATLEQNIHDLAHYDMLTGLVSRHLLLDRLQQVINTISRAPQLAAIAFIDLDNFKPINDHYGHEAGDLVLVNTAKRLKGTLRETDTTSRIGGDEFVLLLNNVRSASWCEDLLKRILLILNVPVTLSNGYSVRVSASIGVSMITDPSLDAEVYLRRADQAMYKAKNTGRNKILFFDPAEEHYLKERRKLLQEAEKGLNNDEFFLQFQPQINVSSGKVIGLEALIRWKHPEKGILYPGHFSDALDHPTLGVIIGEWVLNESIKSRLTLQAAGLVDDCKISINISGYHLQSFGFIDFLKGLLIEYPNIPPKLIMLEVLETVSINDMKSAIDILKQCRELGVGVALDDFGTGYASLSYLKTLPLDILKLDRSFVQNFLEDEKDEAIVKSAVALSSAFGYKMVAEGIESKAHLDALKYLGCDFGQGFYIAKPMNLDKVMVWLNLPSSSQ
jgi:diguanylate cyclase (GGDEF)-like protein